MIIFNDTSKYEYSYSMYLYLAGQDTASMLVVMKGVWSLPQEQTKGFMNTLKF